MKTLKTVTICIFLLFSHAAFSQPITANKLFSSADYSMLQLSPDGKHVTAYYNTKKDHYLSLIELKSNAIISNVRFGVDNKFKGYEWLNNSQLFLSFISNGTYQNLICNLVDNKMKLTLIKANGYLVNQLSKQPDKVMFARKKSLKSKHYNLYIVNIEDLIKDDFSNAQKIKHDSKYVSRYFYDDRLRRVITSEYSEKSKKLTIKYISVKGGKWRKIIALKKTDYFFEPQDFISENKISVLTNKDSDKIILYEFDIPTQELGKILYQHPKYDLSGANFTENGELDFVTYYQHGLLQKRYFDKYSAGFSKRLSLAFNSHETYIIDTSMDRKIKLLYVNGSSDPGEYFINEKDGNVVKRLLLSYEKLEGSDFSPSKTIIVTAKDGSELEAFLTLPKGYNHSTLLVMPHGGPIGIQENDRFNNEVQYYASRGFSVLRVNFRGSSGFGKAFLKKGVGEFGQLIEEDITTVVNEVRKYNKFKYMCSIGASYGGYSAAMLAIKHPDLYDCVIASFGVYDLPLAFNASNFRSGKEYREYLSKTLGQYDKSLKQVSPVYLADKLKAPILLLAGRKDDIASFEHSNRFDYVLRLKQHPVETVFYKNAGHGHDYWSGDRHQASITNDFLMRTLKLKKPDLKQLNAEGIEAIADDYINISDGYTFEELFKPDPQKAFSYLIKAADYNNPRANFNVGGHYHRGERVKQSYKKAVEHYKKSADLGYSSAYARLGRMYMEGEYLNQDWEKALINLKKAVEIKNNPFNKIRLARFYCLAPDEHRDIDRCLKLMDLEQYENISTNEVTLARKRIKETLGWVYAEAKLSTEELTKIQQFTAEIYSLTQTKLSFDASRDGLFEYIENKKFGKSGEYRQISTGSDISSQKNSANERFGVIFSLDISGINSWKDRIAVAARWFVIKENGEKNYAYTTLLYGSPRSEWMMLRSPNSEKVRADYRLELFDLEQKLIFKGQYLVTPPIKQKESNNGQ